MLPRGRHWSSAMPCAAAKRHRMVPSFQPAHVQRSALLPTTSPHRGHPPSRHIDRTPSCDRTPPAVRYPPSREAPGCFETSRPQQHRRNSRH
ncbi:hypothetical protein B0H10DRAFT_2135106 [Mycena sp. CBHHK59/15]|nr:hypothetical protein B0H10DRAFT_2135106 [Mycena sp. CBHHK59/15]